jgi:hypothetical protein
MIFKKKQHDWQQFTDTCVVCGFNAYDEGFPTDCPGSMKLYMRMFKKKQAREKEKRDKEWGDDIGW